MAKKRIARYSRRTNYNRRSSKVWIIILCVVLFLALCVAVSVVIGTLLGQRADEYRTRPQYNFSKYEYKSGNKVVRSIEGYHFGVGSSVLDYSEQGIEDFSMCLRHSNGMLDYRFDVADKVGFDTMGNYGDLALTSDIIHDRGGRACGYFYITSFACEDERLRQIYKAYEIALIGEAADKGIDDILLLGIDVTDENISEIEDYLARAATAADSASLGVAISVDTVMKTANEVYVAERLRSSCDFVALDLCHLTFENGGSPIGESGKSELEEIVDDMEYYIKSYSMRLIFSHEHSRLYKEAMELGIVDFQIVEK